VRRCRKRGGELEELAIGGVGEQPATRLLCRRCATELAQPAETITIDGAVDHTCSNPAGFTYAIRCYRAAHLITNDAPCEAHSWFTGYAWQIGSCPGCGAHLGWRSRGPERPAFVGLIRARVEER